MGRWGNIIIIFLIRLMAATGVRISELVLFDVEDVKKGIPGYLF